jgi:hypothetical protein
VNWILGYGVDRDIHEQNLVVGLIGNANVVDGAGAKGGDEIGGGEGSGRSSRRR